MLYYVCIRRDTHIAKVSEDLAKQGLSLRIVPKSRLASASLFYFFMGWRILYIEESDYLSLYLDNIKVKKNDDEVTLPISDLHTLILDNYSTVLSVHLINALAENNVNVVLCGVDHLPKSTITPIVGNQQMPLFLRKQIEWPIKIKAFVHQSIVKSKIENQVALLKFFKKEKSVIEHISNYSIEVEPGDVTNREGLAAKMYFRELFGSTFRRFDDDVINAGLNFGYAILRSQIAKSIVAKGYHPSLGFFHKGPSNAFNLADDIIESFRPIIDCYVYRHLISEPLFIREHKKALIRLTTCEIMIKGTRQTLFNGINLYIDGIMQFVETGNIESYYKPNLLFHEL